jgi:hypothetical protein
MIQSEDSGESLFNFKHSSLTARNSQDNSYLWSTGSVPVFQAYGSFLYEDFLRNSLCQAQGFFPVFVHVRVLRASKDEGGILPSPFLMSSILKARAFMIAS